MEAITTILGDVLRAEGFSVWIGAILTLMVYSYLLGDNPLSRLAKHLLVGTAVAYGAVIAYHQVLYPSLLRPLQKDPSANWYLVIALVLGLLLLTKSTPSFSFLGNVSIGFMLGVGAGLAMGGAMVGTLLPQVQATTLSLYPTDYGPGLTGTVGAFSALVIVVGTVATLLSFQFTRRHETAAAARTVNRFLDGARKLGRFFLLLAFGALLGNGILTALTLLIGRLQFLFGTWLSITGGR
ncbi:MAG: hypothetical protein GXP41_02790 [Chloroflexi bacterium]|nr:hypothetical protein [Chloroflexota bacterium]